MGSVGSRQQLRLERDAQGVWTVHVPKTPVERGFIKPRLWRAVGRVRATAEGWWSGYHVHPDGTETFVHCAESLLEVAERLAEA